MPAWLAVQRSIAVFFLKLYVSINDMKYFRTVSIFFSRATSILIVDWCQFGPSWIFGLKMELIACAGMVGGTTEQRYLFPRLIC